MEDEIRTYKTGHAFMGKKMLKGYGPGGVTTLANAATITLLRTGAPLTEVKRSLEIVIQDIELRIDREARENRQGVVSV